MFNKDVLNEAWKAWDKLNKYPGFFTVVLFRAFHKAITGLNNIDDLVQALCLALGNQKWAEKAQRTPSRSLQHPGGGTAKHLTNTDFLPLCQEFRRESIESTEHMGSGDPTLSGSLGKHLWAEIHSRHHRGPQRSQTRAYAVTIDPNFHGASCKNKHVLAKAGQSSPLGYQVSAGLKTWLKMSVWFMTGLEFCIYDVKWQCYLFKQGYWEN